MSERVGVWSWQDAIRLANVPPGTKLLCLTLSLYMSSVGRGAWPTVETLVSDTGMKHRAIATHLQRARKAGLLIAKRDRFSDGTLGHYTYFPRFPGEVELSREAAECGVTVGRKSPSAKSADGRHNGKHHPQNLRDKRTAQGRGTRKGISLRMCSRADAKVSSPDLSGNPLDAWGAGE